MATVQDIITSARYDLRDFGGQKLNDAQLVDYINRIIILLDRILINKCSDFTMSSTSMTLSAGNNTATAPTRGHIIDAVFNDSVLLMKESLSDVMYRYQMNNESSSTGTPYYWAYNNGTVYFNIEADVEYTFTVYYHIRTDTLAITDTLPYNDFFNEYIREALVIMASKARDDKIVNVDQQFYTMFKAAVNDAVIGRNFTAKRWLGF